MKKRTLSKLLCLLLILTFIFGLAACTEGRPQNTDSSGTDGATGSVSDSVDAVGEKLPLPKADDENPVLPEQRLWDDDFPLRGFSPGLSFASVVRNDYNFLVHVRVEHCLATGDGYCRYSAAVMDAWEGDLPEKIFLSQGYAARYAPSVGIGIPAFTYGNEVVLFLYPMDLELAEYENSYSASSNGVVFYVVRSDAGETYLVVLYDRFGESVADFVPRYDDPELLKELEENFLESDPIWKELEYSFNYVFRYEDLKAFVQNPDIDFSSHPQYEVPEVLTTPADFDFSVEYGVGLRSHWNSVNTYNGTLTKDLVVAGTKTVDFVLSEDMKNRIYTKLMACDLTSVTEGMYPPNLAAEGEPKWSMKPCTLYDIRFTLNGTSYRIQGSQLMAFYPNHPQARNVTSFLDYVISYVESTPEYQAMPPAEGGYM